MDDSELFNLTVVELRSLCNEKGLEAARLRKKQIVELLVDNGVSGIPENLRDRSTPRKSVRTPVKTPRTTRRSALTPQKNQLDANITLPSNLTPRNARYQRFQQLGKLDETKSSNKENEDEEMEGDSSEEVCVKPVEEIIAGSEHQEEEQTPHPEEKEEEFSDAKEDLHNETTGERAAETNERSTAKDGDAADDAAKEDDETPEVTEKAEAATVVDTKETENSTKENEDTGSACSFTTAASPVASPVENTSRVDKDDDAGSATPRKSRKRWSTSPVADFDFARKSATPTPAVEQNAGSLTSLSAASADGSEPSPDAGTSKDSPQPQRLTRQRTFTVQNPASASTPGVSNASRVGFKASKTPNFKKIHEKNQAKFEDIAQYSARRRDRMRTLLSSAREIRTAATASRDSNQTPKTPLRTAKALSQMETPASERKILSNKVRSNRRFELLMKSRGLPIGEEPPEEH